MENETEDDELSGGIDAASLLQKPEEIPSETRRRTIKHVRYFNSAAADALCEILGIICASQLRIAESLEKIDRRLFQNRSTGTQAEFEALEKYLPKATRAELRNHLQATKPVSLRRSRSRMDRLAAHSMETLRKMRKGKSVFSI